MAAKGPKSFERAIADTAEPAETVTDPTKFAAGRTDWNAGTSPKSSAVWPTIQRETGCPVLASVSIRHNPMDAIEETLHNEPVDELIVSARHHQGPRIAHHDLAHRLGHFNLPITAIESTTTA